MAKAKSAAVTVRNIPAEVHRALRTRAARHGRSTEAEIRQILEDAVRPAQRRKIGTELAAIGRRLGELELKVTRDQKPAEPASFD